MPNNDTTLSMSYIAHFQPKGWDLTDYAINVKAAGPQEWDCTDYVNKHPRLKVEIDEKLRSGDRWPDRNCRLFYNDPQLPEWMNRHGGPFSVYVRYRNQYDTDIPEQMKTSKPANEELYALNAQAIKVFEELLTSWKSSEISQICKSSCSIEEELAEVPGRVDTWRTRFYAALG